MLGQMGDDIVLRTLGWDQLVEAVFERWPDRIVFVHGRDGFLHRRWVDTLSYFVPPAFKLRLH